MSFLGIAVKSGSVLFGYSCVRDNIYKKKVSMVILASDLSLRSKNDIMCILGANNVNFLEIGCTMNEILNSTGRYSGILGITNKEIALKIESLTI